MNLQIIKSMNGAAEYVLLPIGVYNALRAEIKEKLKEDDTSHEYVAFDPADYVDNPVALARIEAGLSQQELAKHMKVTQAYISKLEGKTTITAKTLLKVKQALHKKAK